MTEVGFFRRVAPALVLAAAGGVLLYLLPSGADGDTGSEDILGSETATDVPSGSTATSTPSSAASASGGGSGSGSGGGATKKKQTITGDAIDFRFGTVQVKVVLDGTTITDIKTVTAPGGGYQRFTDRAIPTMKAEILQAQSTRVAAASGATYTSVAYAQSVQSALDRA